MGLNNENHNILQVFTLHPYWLLLQRVPRSGPRAPDSQVSFKVLDLNITQMLQCFQQQVKITAQLFYLEESKEIKTKWKKCSAMINKDKYG